MDAPALVEPTSPKSGGRQESERRVGPFHRPAGSPRMESRGVSVRAGFTPRTNPEGESARKAQPWPFFLVVFFLATFLAAFFFFLAMEMAPCHEHPVTHLTSTPPDALVREWTTFRRSNTRDYSPASNADEQSCGGWPGKLSSEETRIIPARRLTIPMVATSIDMIAKPAHGHGYHAVPRHQPACVSPVAASARCRATHS